MAGDDASAARLTPSRRRPEAASRQSAGARWAQTLRRGRAERELFVYCNNYWEGFAPARDARWLERWLERRLGQLAGTVGAGRKAAGSGA